MPALRTINWMFICCLAFCIGGMLVLNLMPLASDCICPISIMNTKIRNIESQIHNASIPKVVHKLALLVPFRDRFEELLQFVPHMTTFLKKQGIPHHIFILNQVDRYRFNRASLINVGFRFTSDVYDYIAMHDIDLLPLNDDLRYDFPQESGPLHIAAPNLHPKYHYATFVGGILLVRGEHFKAMNGMSNNYWGWGLEDDEFFVRIRDAGLSVSRPENIKTGVNNTFSHIHNGHYRKRDTQKCFNQKQVTRRRDHHTGLNTLRYKIPKVYNMEIEGIKITVLNIILECDLEKTPWCDCSGAAAAAVAEDLKIS